MTGNSYFNLHVACLAAGAMLTATPFPARALVFNTIWDTSISSRQDATVIEQAVLSEEARYTAALASPVTVNIKVSWGKVANSVLSSTALGASIDQLVGYKTYAQVAALLNAAATTTSDLTAAAALPASMPAAGNQYVIPRALAKALGVIPATSTTIDGYIGFGSGVAFTFNDTNGVAAGTYDFATITSHELSEVLGRVTGLYTAAPAFATPLDVFRYSAPGVTSFSYSAPAYASIDGGVTSLGWFNNSPYGGDRGDWLTIPGISDSQAAFLPTATLYQLSPADLRLLDALGWNGLPTLDAIAQGIVGSNVTTAASVSEPASLGLLAASILGSVAVRRRFGRRA
jgi:hypothetical protein